MVIGLVCHVNYLDLWRRVDFHRCTVYVFLPPPVPNFNVWVRTGSIPDQAVTVWIMWSCYGNLGTMLISRNYTNRNQRPELSVNYHGDMVRRQKHMTNPDQRTAKGRLLGE